MLQPKTEADLAALIAGRTAPLRIIGGGTRDVGAPVKGEVLSLRGLSGIVDYEPGAMTLVVKAGTSLAEVDAALAQEGQRLAFEPADWRALLGTTGEPTVGGMVASGLSGPSRASVGAVRDFVFRLNFEVVSLNVQHFEVMPVDSGLKVLLNDLQLLVIWLPFD